jgi:hypothetical protein
LGISVATIQHAKHNFKEHGDVEGCPGKVGRRGKLDTYMEQVPGFYSFSNHIDACLDGSQVPSAYLNEYLLVFEEFFGVKLSEARISQILHVHGLSHKRIYSYIICINLSFKRKHSSAIKNCMIIGTQN